MESNNEQLEKQRLKQKFNHRVFKSRMTFCLTIRLDDLNGIQKWTKRNEESGKKRYTKKRPLWDQTEKTHGSSHGPRCCQHMENHGKSDETHHRLHPRLLFETVERPQIPKEIIFDTPMALYWYKTASSDLLWGHRHLIFWEKRRWF